MKKAIVWFRQDLRLHDNEAFVDASHSAEEVFPVYIFDERIFQNTTRFGFAKTGPHRARFILESVIDLRASLRSRGSDLIIRFGIPEVEIFNLAKDLRTNWVFCNRERTQEEVDVQDALEKALWSIGQEVRFSRGKMLYYTSDLPFPVTQTPDVFTQFRKEVEKIVPVRPLLSEDQLTFTQIHRGIDIGDMPSPANLGISDSSEIRFKGGESQALQRLQYYIWDSKCIKTYKSTRNGLLGDDYSSKFSPYLAQGCLSPKKIYWEIKRFESAHGANESTYWLFFELLWRDFFRLIGKKHGNAIFQLNGFSGQQAESQVDQDQFKKWQTGQTGVPFVDANMRELNATGFMSNRGRQNVASFLIHNLGINWLIGAEYFESLLIDYDPCSNYGNWNYLAGVGSDPRQDRVFNIASQSKRYDPQGEYMLHWIPELQGVPVQQLHTSTGSAHGIK